MRNPKLMTLMFAGCKVIYPSGYVLQGLPNDRYIQLGMYMVDGEPMASDGLCDLSEEGLEMALRSKDSFEEDHRNAVEMNLEIDKIEMQ